MDGTSCLRAEAGDARVFTGHRIFAPEPLAGSKLVRRRTGPSQLPDLRCSSFLHTHGGVLSAALWAPSLRLDVALLANALRPSLFVGLPQGVLDAS